MNFNELDFSEEFTAAFDAMENMAGHMFVTGKAGTGKSTLLQYFRLKTQKNIAVLAPTGVSAINIKGQTIHSFFQFRPDITPSTVGDIIIRKQKKQLFRSLQALIIDEISMVRADLMDCIDVMLRLHGPHHDRPFGGVQMIFFGDLFQLPPVVNRFEESIFKTRYPTPFFFSAKAFETLQFKIFELQKIYRQKDEQFIHLLNAVRDNALSVHHLSAFNTRFLPQHKSAEGEFYITLTTTNALADKVNMEKLNELPGRPYLYEGIIAGEFDRKGLPTAERLELKKGAQVMMLNNDQDKRWVNGSLGIVKAVKPDAQGNAILIVDLENGKTVDVKQYNWEIYQYYFDEELQSLSSKTMGYFTQYPLKLAWAVTIHKSQGQTFDKVIIDVGFGTFSHGQMYVALSRCTSLNGVVLKQPMAARHVLLDERVADFHRKRVRSAMVAGFLFLLAVFSSGPSMADNRDVEISKSLTRIQEKKATAQTWEGRHSNAPYVALLNEYETKINPDWSHEETYHVRLKIQKESARQLGQWPIYYNKARQEITQIKAFVETPDGKKAESTDIKESDDYPNHPLYSDMKIKIINMPQVSVGSILDITVKTKVLRKEIAGAFWEQVPWPAIPTKFSRHTYIFPQSLDIAYKTYKRDYKPVIKKKGDITEYSFVFEQNDGLIQEELMPPLEEVLGNVYVSSIKDWNTVADWMRLLINKNTVDDPLISSKAQKLVKSGMTQKDKARSIIEFAQDNYKYIAMDFGDHMIEPHPTPEVFKAPAIDSKDMALLVRQMLQTVGIDSNVCLMVAEFAGNPQNALPNVSIFQHVLLEMVLDGQKFFVDPQTRGYDFGQHPSGYDNAHVMVIEKDKYRFDNLPVAPQEDHMLVSRSDIALTAQGGATFSVHVQLPLEASQHFRNQWVGATPEEKKKFFEGLQVNYVQNGTLLSHEVKGTQDRYGPVTLDLKYQSPEAYPVVNDMLILKEAQQSDLPDFSDPKRLYPIFMPINAMIKNTNVYHFPDGYKLDFLPKSYELAVDFARTSTDYTSGGEDNTVTVTGIYRTMRATVGPQQYKKIQQFAVDMAKSNNQYVVLRRKADVAPQTKEWLNKT